MSTYYCKECDMHMDNDRFPCEEDPRNPGELVCGDCLDDILYEEELEEEDTTA